MIDKHTYGDSPAAIDLVRIIQENDLHYFVTRKITRILNGFNNVLVATNHVEKKYLIQLIALVYEDFEKKCDSLDERVISHTKTVLRTTYKNWQRRKNIHRIKK